MEVLAVGAVPTVVVDNLCVELDPTGNAILAGIRDVCDSLAQPPVITGSDETNMPTSQTGVGITVIGVVDVAACRLGTSREGDVVWAVGRPIGGPHVTPEERLAPVAGPRTIEQLLVHDAVHEVLPVGSRGIAYEVGELAKGAGLEAALDEGADVDLRRSAADSAVVLVSVEPGVDLRETDLAGLPVVEVARLHAPSGIGPTTSPPRGPDTGAAE
jgi:hypothetical protein